jgi:hypothetical protein
MKTILIFLASRFTGKPEVIDSSVGLVPTNALALTGLANFLVVGYSEVIPDWPRKLIQYRNLVAGRKRSGGGRVGGQKFVAINLGGNSPAAVRVRIDPHNRATAADVHSPGLRHLLRQGDHKLDFAADFETGINHKIEAAVTYVARLRLKFGSMRFTRQDAQRQGHSESPRFAAVGSVTHVSPGWMDSEER